MTAEGGFKKLVVGVDGSVQAGHALEWAIRLAEATGAEIVAVYAIPPPSYYEFGAGYGVPVVPAELDPEWRSQAIAEFQGSWCAPLAASGVRFRTVVEDGRPAAVIGAVAERENADLVVVGRRGRGEVAEVLLGSVSHDLSHHCARPVLLVSPEREAAGELERAASIPA